MFAYYLDLALRSLKRNPALTALMIVTIGFGVAASMTTWSVFRAVSGDPIPQKSAELFVPQIDNWGPSGHAPGSKSTQPPDAMDYTDAIALMRAHRAKYQSAMYQIADSVMPKHLNQSLTMVAGEAVSSEFFPMFDVPFEYGTGWSAADDANRAHVVVLSGKLNATLFGGRDSVGKVLTFGHRDYRMVGVTRDWNPQPVFYDVVNTGGFSEMAGGIFMPFTTAIAAHQGANGTTNCQQPPAESGFKGLLKSECVWISFMVQLDGAAAVRDYHQFLVNYAATQQQAGRFTWAPNVRLRGLMDWLDFQHVVPPDTKISLYVALGLLLVCLVNVMGLLLAKFMRRGGEIGVRRALGASRRQIYAQFLTEAGMVGLAGGVLGLGLTALGVAGIGLVMPRDIAALAHFNASLLFATLIVAIVATMLAGLYPTLRAAAVQPAWQLKSN
ncbi:MAG: FtsX-like permease family protein [Rhodanobacteraceae bacterium]|nr:MAG: FtsX-like permease family protein [Rhodanobacteraceae bacterium]